LFWKKKSKADVELDSRYDDSREAFRIAPDKSHPIIISIMGNSFHALNISGTGVAIRSHNFPVGTRTQATVRLPSQNRLFPVVLEVVEKQNDLCHCCFREIHTEAENLLHAYILELQKNKIRLND